MTKTKIIYHAQLGDNNEREEEINRLVESFAEECEPLEREHLSVLTDLATGATYVECHILASRLIGLGTIDVPLDPEDQPEYRANREIVEDHVAFEQMKGDALSKRTFSNIVCEFNRAFDPSHPIKIIGGQHRFSAIRDALRANVDVYHGIKIYFGLDTEQRLDVQLISNTNIAVSTDLFDRMQETLSGPELRNWCQIVGLLESGQDFADKRARTNPLTVRTARTFILNYYRGTLVNTQNFEQSETTPIICKSGVADSDWESLKKEKPNLWSDQKLKTAGIEFAALIAAQRNAIKPSSGKRVKVMNIDFAEKALNSAVLSAWAFTAGVLSKNEVRLTRHYALKSQAGRDPLNAAALAKGRHKSDAENYRGLGYRTDAKERGRLVELFYLQAEKGDGITAATIDLAIKKYHAKEATLEVIRAERKGNSN
ncbi:hypothetical protein [Nitrosospira multiformis]|uniref:Uncharacterized protein n=1 Tax=Nitrosospira multiformis TaxID=1231 RepID=A0A1I7HRY0_9PROT|nr:hypothetical protein [Nitrosospira multiformis]SFU63474.1 hypothetical protein SAMN05216417_11163 [Nitrosospira multiformis]